MPNQLHCAPLASCVCSSVIAQVSAGVPETPVTLACNVTWPLTGTEAVAGETVTVTLLKLVPLPPPQPAMTISNTSGATSNGARQFIQRLQNVRGCYTRFSAYTRQKGRDPLGKHRPSSALPRSSDERRGMAVCVVIGDKSPFHQLLFQTASPELLMKSCAAAIERIRKMLEEASENACCRARLQRTGISRCGACDREAAI